MSRTYRRGLALLAGLFAIGALVSCSDDDGTSPPPPPTQLTVAARAALDEALQDAYRTYTTYDVATDDLGAVEPFTTIVATELANVNALKLMYTSRGLTAPASLWNAGNVVRFQNREQACLAAEEYEVATAMMFDRVLQIGLPDDVEQAFTQQRTSAREQHRVAFRACAGAATPVNGTVQAAMAEALQLEFRSYFTYQRVIDDLGNIAPFVTIHDAEWVHVGAASNLFVKRNLAVPASAWSLSNVPTFAASAAACAAAVDQEIELVMTYDRLLLKELPTDVEMVFEHLREASLESHLPAFQQCAGNGTPAPSAEVLAAMGEAIQDEYRAYFTYAGVVEDLDPDFPFDPIRDAEKSHYTAIANLYLKRGLTVPVSDWTPANVPTFATRLAACDAAVPRELANIAMYDRLLALTLPDDVKLVFERLRAASHDRHLPAFTACASPIS